MTDDPTQTDAEQTGNRIAQLADAEWEHAGKLAVGAVLGLLVNSVVVAALTGADIPAIAEGVAFLTPAVALAVVLFDRYDPLEMPYLSAILMFLTVWAANTITATVRAFRMISDPIMGLVLIGLVGLIFTPGAFLGAYIARRWWA